MQGRQRDFEDEVVQKLTLWCGEPATWHTKKKVIETFKNSPMWNSWVTAGHNEKKLVNLINRLKIKNLEDGHDNHNGGGASEFEPLKPEFVENTADAEGEKRKRREQEHSSQDAVLTTAECTKPAAENGDEDRRTSARIRAPRHKAPPTGLFSTVFFQHGDATESLRIGGRTLRRVHADPNIFLIDGFLTEFEMQHLDSLITPATFAKSYTDAEDGTKVVDDYRTSTFVHLAKACDTYIRNIESRAANMIGMPPDMVEPLQVVKYSQGQKFETHHDMGTLGEDNTVEQVIPPRRLVTFFIYLNSLPKDAGGHTEFPLLHLKVQPVRGQALLFCNVCQCGKPDSRVIHRACAVKGNHLKVGMNLWVVDQSLAGLACVGKGGAGGRRRGTPGAVILKEKGGKSKGGSTVEEGEGSAKKKKEKKGGLLQMVAHGEVRAGLSLLQVGKRVKRDLKGTHVKKETYDVRTGPSLSLPLSRPAPRKARKTEKFVGQEEVAHVRCGICGRVFKNALAARSHALQSQDEAHQEYRRKHNGVTPGLFCRSKNKGQEKENGEETPKGGNPAQVLGLFLRRGTGRCVANVLLMCCYVLLMCCQCVAMCC